MIPQNIAFMIRVAPPGRLGFDWFKYCWVSLWLGFLASPLQAQGQWMNDYLGGEEVLYAETKQVNQFFRRFNCEEAPDGKRYYPGDELYHDRELRREYMYMLFDQQRESISPTLKETFVNQVMSLQAPLYLDFHGGEWFAEVATTFRWQGRNHDMTLFMKLEEAEVGSKWVFTKAYFEPFEDMFEPDGEARGRPQFIHPLSHELDFMNLIKVFRAGNPPETYTERGFQPDYLTLFLYEIKKGNLSFKTVNQVKFHFFQVDGWYFELSDVVRAGPNRGWLITELSRLEEGNKALLLQYIYRR